MPSLSLPDRLIWFAHCPKAGGTSVETFMVETWGEAVGHLHWGWDLWWRGGGWRLADPPNSPQHLVWADAARTLDQAPDAVFALVRDPVARMASEYRWQQRPAGHGGRRGTRLGKLLARLPFSLWLRLMLAAARRNPHAFDNHFRPQTEFVPEGAAVFRLEDGLAPALSWLAETAGTPPPITPPHALAGQGGHPVAREEAALIGQVFAVDYARFGYARPALARPRPGLDLLVRLAGPALARLDRSGRL